MKFKEYINKKEEDKIFNLEADSILIHLIYKLVEEFENDNIKKDFMKVIEKGIKKLGETEI